VEIQRYPLGLAQLLEAKTESSPLSTAQGLVLTLETLQFYAVPQRQVVTTSGATQAMGLANQLHFAGAPSLVPITQQWAVLFAVEFTVVEATGLTALSTSIQLTRNAVFGATGGGGVVIASNQKTNATVNGALFPCAKFLDYPIVLIPPWDIGGRIDLLAGVANAVTSLGAEIGLLS